MDLPCEDDSAGLRDYADTVVEAVGDKKNVVLVAQSFGGFTAPLVCDRLPVDLLVLVAGMVTEPGEPASDYWENTGWPSPSFDDVEQRDGVSKEDAWNIAAFHHDVPPELTAEALKRTRGQSDTPGNEPWPLGEWPAVPTRFLLCRDVRFFPDWMRKVVKERLGITPDEIEAGHCVALSRPKELADRLADYVEKA